MAYTRNQKAMGALLALVVIALMVSACTEVAVMAEEPSDGGGPDQPKPKATRQQFEALATINHKAPITLPWVKAAGGKKLPSYLKYDESKLTKVIDQHACASCWSIATTGMLADRISVYTNGAIKEELSNQEMISCWDGHQGKGCSVGGVPEMAYSYLINQGIALEKDYPYDQQTTTKIPPCDEAKRSGRRVFAERGSDVSLCIDPYQYKEGSERYNSTVRANAENMKRELYLHGPVVGTMMVYDGAYEYDGMSVYTGPKRGEKFVGGHALTIIGFCEEGVNGDEPGFEQAYWICKQSWGKEYPAKTPAAKGYMYIKMGTNCVGIESRASACLPVITPEMSAKMAKSLDQSRFSSYEEYRQSATKTNFITKTTRLRRAYERLQRK